MSNNQDQEIVIRLKSFDHNSLERASEEIVNAVKRTGAVAAGPIPLPCHIERFTVLRSPHVNKKSREQFEIRTQKRLIIIGGPTPRTVEALEKVNLGAGVEVEINLN